MINGLSKVYVRVVLGHPTVILILLSLLLLFFSYHAKDFKLDASPDTLLLEDDKDLKIFREIVERYGTKELLVVTFTPHEDLFSDGSLQLLKKLRDRLRPLDRVDSVVTILDIPLLETSDVELSDITEEKIKTIEDTAVDKKRAILSSS